MSSDSQIFCQILDGFGFKAKSIKAVLKLSGKRFCARWSSLVLALPTMFAFKYG